MDCKMYEKQINKLERELEREKEWRTHEREKAEERISELRAKVNFSEDCERGWEAGHPCYEAANDRHLYLVYVKTSNKKNTYSAINFLYCGGCGEMYKIVNKRCSFDNRNVKCKVCVEVE